MHKKQELAGVAFLLAAIFIALALVSYSKWDPSFFTESTYRVGNYGGVAGAYLSDLLFTLLGVSAFFIPFFLAASGVRRILQRPGRRAHLAGAALFTVSFSLVSGLTGIDFAFTGWNSGGFIGERGAGLLVRYLSHPGGYVFAIFSLVSSLVLLSPVPVRQLRQFMGRAASPALPDKKAPAPGRPGGRAQKP
nr:DNA translocase FtsK 4TM domain-containing protein [Nitrospiraceae bacterium]